MGSSFPISLGEVARIQQGSNVDTIIEEVKEKLENDTAKHPDKKAETVTRVRRDIRMKHPSEYSPKFMSFGPYHCDDPNLRDAEHLKCSYLKHLIGRNANPQYILRRYISILLSAKLDELYENEYVRDKFILTLLFDCCFLLEFILKFNEKKRGVDRVKLKLKEIPVSLIIRDMLLVENQIPFRILQSLNDISPYSYNNLTDMAYDVVVSNIPAVNDIHRNNSHTRARSVLDIVKTNCNSSPINLLHISYCSILPKTHYIGSCSLSFLSIAFWWSVCLLMGVKSRKWNPVVSKKLPSVTYLLEHGISFEVDRYSAMLDIDFDANKGIIKIPVLVLDSATATHFRNLLVFEQSLALETNYVGAFISFWDGLIHSPHDVAHLEKIGILENKLGNNELVGDFFNDLGTSNTLRSPSNYLANLMLTVKDYCSFYKHHRRSLLVRNQFSNPWTTIYVYAGLIVIALTIAKTTLGILCYMNDLKNNQPS